MVVGAGFYLHLICGCNNKFLDNKHLFESLPGLPTQMSIKLNAQDPGKIEDVLPEAKDARTHSEYWGPQKQSLSLSPFSLLDARRLISYLPHPPHESGVRVGQNQTDVDGKFIDNTKFQCLRIQWLKH